MTNISSDFRYAFRVWRRQPLLIATVVLAIGVAIGATVAMFSVVNAVLIKPLVYKDQGSLVIVWDNFLRLNMENLPAVPAETVDYAKLNRVFKDLSGFRYTEFNISEAGKPATRALGARVSANLFSMLGTPPLLGRALVPSDEQSTNGAAAVLSYGLWQRMTAGNTGIVGQTITMNGTTYTIVGVMPAEFQFPMKGVRFPRGADLWVPAQLSAQEVTDRDSHAWYVVARLKAGVSLPQAQTNMDEIANQLDRTYPNYRGPKGADGGWKITVRPLLGEVVGASWIPLALLSSAVGFVFLIACFNIASLLLARATDRQAEITIRSTLGATRSRIVQQLFTETLLLSAVGGALGVGLASAIIRILSSSYAEAVPRLTEASIDGRVLLFTAAVVIVAATLFGLAPALYVSHPVLGSSLQQGASRGNTASKFKKLARESLVTVEIAMALVLLIGAGLLVRSFQRILSVDPGFDTSHAVAFTVSLSENKYPTPKEWASFYQRALERIRAVPAVKSASMASYLPLDDGPRAPFSIEGKPYDPTQMPPVIRFQSTGADYFHSLGIPLVAGRDFTGDDIDGSKPVAAVNQALASQFFPVGDVLGRRVKIGAPTAPGSWLTIIAISSNAKSSGLDAPAGPEMYIAFPHRPTPAMKFIVRTNIDSASLMPSISQQLATLDNEQPVFGVRTIREMVDGSLAPRKFSMLLTAILAAVALVLAAAGLFGIIYYLVAQRTREMAVRMALGAKPAQVLFMVLAHGLRPALIGAATGLLIAFLFNRIIASMLFNLTATDLVSYAVSTAIMVFLALLATYLPARRITRIQPHVALRHE